MENWHTITAEEAIKKLNSSENGISRTEAGLRLKKYGPNMLISKSQRNALKILIEQFTSPLVILLIVAIIISVFLENLTDALAISAIVVMNAILGFHQEYKAERAVEALKKLTVSKVLVLRKGEIFEENSISLVPGDVIVLEEGNRVPADVRLIETINMQTNEASLTGESTPIEKIVEPIKDVPVADRKNMAFMGTLVTYGRGKGIVVATGMSTEFGKIAKLVQQREEPTPLQIKLSRFSKQLGIIIVAIAAVLFAIGIFRQQPLFLMFLTAVSLAVAAIPEGLPAVTTLTLTIGVQRMLKRNTIVKRLASVEALGSVTVICADKTGTMTSNQMTVKKIWVSNKLIDVTGVGFEPKGKFLLNNKEIDPKKEGSLENLIKVAYLCNNAVVKKDGGWHILGDPTEGALKVLSMKAGLKYNFKRINEIPFSSERKKMTTIYDVKGDKVAFSKGAPEVVLDMCDKIYPNRTLSKEDKAKILKVFQNMAANGLRTLGFAYRNLPDKYDLKKVEFGMTFVGLAGMIDPPTKETISAVKSCKDAGIRVVMITGDHALTAKAVAKEIGLTGDILSGEEIEKLKDEELEKMLDNVNIFARVSPEHKLRIVDLLRKKGNIVAVTGDGVNDAPALKKANIGVAMGIKGTDVAKEASDMILTDDNFSSIVAAVDEGRGIYDNIKKFIRYLLAANLGEVMLVSIAMFLFLPLPLLPIQLLWLNLITDGVPALALGVDPKEEGIMKRKPRGANESILHNELIFMLVGGFANFISSFVAFLLFLPYGEILARTAAFSTMTIFELFFVFNCRSETKSIFRKSPLTNKKLLVAVTISVLLQIAIVQFAFLDVIFDTEPLSISQWIMVMGLASVGFLVLPEIFIKRLGYIGSKRIKV